MNARTNPEMVLKQEHAAGEAQRTGNFVLNVVLALVLARAAAAGQLPAPRFIWWVTALGAAAALAILLTLRIALQWDRAVVLRLGRFHALKDPGVFWLAPFVDQIARYVDMRIRATEFYSESTLTRDMVPV